MDESLFAFEYFMQSTTLGWVPISMTVDAPVFDEETQRYSVRCALYINNELDYERTTTTQQSLTALNRAISHHRLHLERILTMHNSALYATEEEAQQQLAMPIDALFMDRTRQDEHIPRNPLLYTRDLSEL